MHRHRLTTLVVVLALVGAAGCAAFGGGRGGARRDTVRLYVDNQNFNDATIYARYGGMAPMRLGQVVGKTQEVFTFPYRNADLRLEIRLLAGDSHMTQPIQVYRGDELDLIIPSNLDRLIIR